MNPEKNAVIHSRTTLHKGRTIELVRDNVTLPNDFTTDLDVILHPGAAAIVPYAGNGKVKLIRQYRHAVGGYIWEIPAGNLEPGEDPLDCGKRELIEETGFSAKNWTPLGEITPVPGYSNERIHLFLAEDLSPASRNLDEDEVLSVHEMDLAEVFAMMLDGRFTDGKSMAALSLARMKLESR